MFRFQPVFALLLVLILGCGPSAPPKVDPRGDGPGDAPPVSKSRVPPGHGKN